MKELSCAPFHTFYVTMVCNTRSCRTWSLVMCRYVRRAAKLVLKTSKEWSLTLEGRFPFYIDILVDSAFYEERTCCFHVLVADDFTISTMYKLKNL